MILSSALSKKTGAWYTVSHLPYTSFEGMFFFQGQSQCALVLYGDILKRLLEWFQQSRLSSLCVPFSSPYSSSPHLASSTPHIRKDPTYITHRSLVYINICTFRAPCPHLICYRLHDLIALLISSSTTKISRSDHSALHTSLYCKIQTYPVMLGRKALWDFHAQMSERFILMMTHSPHS